MKNQELNEKELKKVTGGTMDPRSTQNDGKPYRCQYCGNEYDTQVLRDAHKVNCPNKPSRGAGN